MRIFSIVLAMGLAATAQTKAPFVLTIKPSSDVFKIGSELRLKALLKNNTSQPIDIPQTIGGSKENKTTQ